MSQTVNAFPFETYDKFKKHVLERYELMLGAIEIEACPCLPYRQAQEETMKQRQDLEVEEGSKQQNMEEMDDEVVIVEENREKTLSNVSGRVVKHTSTTTGVIEGLTKTWNCSFSTSTCIFPRGVKEKIFPVGIEVQVKAELTSKKEPVQYIATCVWLTNKDTSGQTSSGADNLDKWLYR